MRFSFGLACIAGMTGYLLQVAESMVDSRGLFNVKTAVMVFHAASVASYIMCGVFFVVSICCFFAAQKGGK